MSESMQLTTNDGQIVTVDPSVYRQFFALPQGAQLQSENPIILKDVSSATMAEVVTYCDRHRLETSNTYYPNEWDYAFINQVAVEALLLMIQASNELGIQPLLNLATSRLARGQRAQFSVSPVPVQ